MLVGQVCNGYKHRPYRLYVLEFCKHSKKYFGNLRNLKNIERDFGACSKLEVDVTTVWCFASLHMGVFLSKGNIPQFIQADSNYRLCNFSLRIYSAQSYSVSTFKKMHVIKCVSKMILC